MVLRKVLGIARPLMPMLIGTCLGIALSLVFAPFLDEECGGGARPGDSGDPRGAQAAGGRSFKALQPDSKDNLYDLGVIDDFEPVIKQLPKPEPGAEVPAAPRKLLRPRYASTELGIREKLFVGVLTSRKSIDSMGVAVNKTVFQYVTKLVFFMDVRGPSLPTGMSVVSFSDDRHKLRPFHMFKYVGDHYVKNFDYFMFLQDDTYIRGEKILDMVSHISVSQDVYMGHAAGYHGYCKLDSAIILSQSMFSRVYDNLDWCMKNSDSETDTAEANVGTCLNHALALPCMETVGGYNFTHYSKPIHFDAMESTLQFNTDFNKALSIGPLSDDITVYKVHRYFCERELNLTMTELEATKDKIVQMSPLTPGGRASATWPIGVEPPSSAKTRFDIIKWDYFNETHLLLDTEFSNLARLTGVHKQDIDEILKVSMQKLNEKHNSRFTDMRLINGYRRFDPVRGMEYKVDMMLKDKVTGIDVEKRVNLLRPLSFVEIVPMPYVTENTRVNLVLPVTATDRDGVVSFLDSYAHTCLDSGDNANLFVLFIYEQLDFQNSKEDLYSVLKSMISYYESKYQNGARIAWTAVQSHKPDQFLILDTISKKFPAETLFLLCTVGMELSIEFLNRVRMNTIGDWQVFFPIGFWQYKPNLVYEEKPYPTTIEINKNVGHFDANSYEHASFYNSDYMAARKEMNARNKKDNIDLFDLFLKYSNVHVFRADEPALIHRYSERQCAPTMAEEAYSLCLASRSEGLASRAQLAMLIFQNQQKVDQDLMDVIHQQNAPNVDQMKPNMRKLKYT